MFHIIFTPLNLYCPSALQEDIKKLSYITKRQHMIGSELMENFQTSQFTVRMSRDTYSQLRQQKKFLSERKHAILWNIIQASKTRSDELDKYINHKIFLFSRSIFTWTCTRASRETRARYRQLRAA